MDTETSLSKYLVNYLNELRTKNRIPPVNYANTGYSKFKAKYMLKDKFYGHYDRKGLIPPYYYNMLNQYHYMEENLCYISSEGGIGFFSRDEAVNRAKHCIYDMIYEDGDSGWGHRDSLLDPCHNYADIYVSYNANAIYLVVTMITAKIEWTQRPILRNGLITLRGNILGNVEPKSILIFHYEPNPDLVNKSYYTLGNPVAGVVPYPYKYPKLKTIRPLEWVFNKGISSIPRIHYSKSMANNISFSISFPFLFTRRGMYSILFTSILREPINWKPYTNKRKGECNLAIYTILI
ncbi:CAP domain-containing protein [Stygiolobus caldivivus]|uniref:SCP domain-containing protein n=1 Tax=Stygiolobus caldivivus TaxID=2824673 RepID=A0A8D5U6X3_9CREN|nr:hypothetical protein [Stygiolobus caldivivus]BCU70428.1 hypothetical protein KN1_17250 [Stygiolobus caldivivus]